MDDCSIAGRAETLRREIELIQQEEQCYRSHRSHSLTEYAEHEKRKFRVLAIREELRTLVEKAKQQSRPRISLVQSTSSIRKRAVAINRDAVTPRLRVFNLQSRLQMML